ncbi:hypothetical protein AVEN_56284-1 [Araneus ventricosus]|uniref:Uncharacterized protein n=1 Tax=Araneus ventricosus TaxID=182803 RepID=A0A4Y2TZ43_ARAVE|nr:hypothetical protein AVEN_56284-1 [Araneus ventricosus]
MQRTGNRAASCNGWRRIEVVSFQNRVISRIPDRIVRGKVPPSPSLPSKRQEFHSEWKSSPKNRSPVAARYPKSPLGNSGGRNKNTGSKGQKKRQALNDASLCFQSFQEYSGFPGTQHEINTFLYFSFSHRLRMIDILYPSHTEPGGPASLKICLKQRQRPV